MDLATIGIIALVISTPVVLWDLVTPNASRLKEALLPYTQFAYLACFIAGFGLLLKAMSFAAVLLLATVLTGAIWLWDRYKNRRVAAVRTEPALEAAESKSAAAAGVPIWRELGASFFPVILIVFVVRSFLVEPFRIPSGSMIPTLLVGDFILVNKFAYGVRVPVLNKKLIAVGDPQRGDVMVFRYPKDPSLDYIKRVIGLPGDTVVYRDKRLFINGEAATQVENGEYDYIDGLSVVRQKQYLENLGGRVHTALVDIAAAPVPGPVEAFPYRDRCQYDITGFTCTVPEGHYLMMGDNRDHSSDSRYWGFVPENHIVGKAFLIWMNFGQFKRVGTRIR